MAALYLAISRFSLLMVRLWMAFHLLSEVASSKAFAASSQNNLSVIVERAKHRHGRLGYDVTAASALHGRLGNDVSPTSAPRCLP